MLQGHSNSEKLYHYLMGVYHNPYGVAGLMGNLHAESGLDPTNLEDRCAKQLRANGFAYCTDAAYTEAVDKGLITKEEFMNPLGGKFGYGIGQWTWPKRKEDLYDFCKAHGASIGDLECQAAFLVQEISTSYPSVHEAILTATDIRTASDIVLTQYEKPKVQSESVKQLRALYGQKYYDEFANLVEYVDDADDPKVVEFNIGDKVIVNGKVFGNGKGTGNVIEKKDATMYVVGLVDRKRYPYYIGVSNTKDGIRQGWTNTQYLVKLSPSPETTQKVYQTVTATLKAQSKLLSLRGNYVTTTQLYMRNGAGTHNPSLVVLPKGHMVTCYGYFTSFVGTKWFYVETILKNVKYTGFCSSNYLMKLEGK